MSLRAHYDAIAAKLKASLPANYKVYEWDVPEIPTYPYVLLWGGIGTEDTEALCGTPDTLNLRPKVTYAGQTGAQLLVAVDVVRVLLSNKVIPVAGWSPSRFKQESLIDAQADPLVTIPATKTHPVFCVDEFPFTSQRA
jgi:hypothetical protein